MNDRNFSSSTILITGGAGFIGSNFIYFISKLYPNAKIINLDKLTYAGNIDNLNQIDTDYSFVHGDIASQNDVEKIFDGLTVDCVVNFAAESHVDRSIHDVTPFIKTNISGTANLLEIANAKWKKDCSNKLFVHISTDEVYGSLGPSGKFTEDTPIAPKNPYSASKAAADMMVQAFVNTHNFPALITRCSNNYGPYQFPEKLIPLTIINILNGKEIPIYGDGKQVRDWIFVSDHCDGIEAVMRKGEIGEVYNLGGKSEMQNIDMAHEICQLCDKAGVSDNSKNLITFVKDRPGHDRRYAMDISKVKNEFGWEPKNNQKDGLEKTVNWYLENKSWWTKLLNRDFDNYYTKQYKDR